MRCHYRQRNWRYYRSDGRIICFQEKLPMLLTRQRIAFLIGCQAALCLLETYLISKISLIGKIGIALVHHEYKLLRSGWKTFLLLFALQLILIVVLSLVKRNSSRQRATIINILLLLAGAFG